MTSVDDQREPETPGENPKGQFADTVKKAAASRLDAARALGTLGSVGLSFVIAIVLGTALGLWLDRLTGWSPTFFLIFFVLGLAAGILNVYRAISNLPK